MKTRYENIDSFQTKDGSVIRELMHPLVHGGGKSAVFKQSFAEATVSVGICTVLHKHHITEELYHITKGQGVMVLGDKQFDVAEGDTVCIPPGTPHCIKNTGNMDLVFFCSCVPAYSHDDTELLLDHV